MLQLCLCPDTETAPSGTHNHGKIVAPGGWLRVVCDRRSSQILAAHGLVFGAGHQSHASLVFAAVAAGWVLLLQILDMYESQDVVKSNAAGAQANNVDDDWEL